MPGVFFETDIERARQLEEGGRRAAAIAVLLNALDRAPSNTAVLCHLASVYYSVGDYDMTLQCANRVVQLDFRIPEAHLLRSYALLGKDQNIGAREAASNASSVSPEDWRPHVAMCRCHIAGEKPRYAEDAANAALALAQDEPDIYIALAEAYEAGKRWHLVERAARAAIVIDEDYTPAYTLLARALGKMRRRREAFEVYLHVLSLDQTDIVARDYLGRRFMLVPHLAFATWGLLSALTIHLCGCDGATSVMMGWLSACITSGIVFYASPRWLLDCQQKFKELPAHVRDGIIAGWRNNAALQAIEIAGYSFIPFVALGVALS